MKRSVIAAAVVAASQMLSATGMAAPSVDNEQGVDNEQRVVEASFEVAEERVKFLVDLGSPTIVGGRTGGEERGEEDDFEADTPSVRAKLVEIYQLLRAAKQKYLDWRVSETAGDSSAAQVAFASMCLKLANARVKLTSAKALAAQPPQSSVYTSNHSAFDRARLAISTARDWSSCP